MQPRLLSERNARLRDARMGGSSDMSELAMKETPVGRTGISVSPICFGTSGLGDMPDTYGYSVEADRAAATLKAIFEGPVNFLDTSRIYGFGRSEERIGAVIRERGGLPKGFVVSTKLDRDPETNVFDAAQARRSIEQSLKALNLDAIDILHLHDPEHARSFEAATSKAGALGELFRIKEEGLAKAVGLAMGPVAKMMPLLRDWDFDALIDLSNRFYPRQPGAASPMLGPCEEKRGSRALKAAPVRGRGAGEGFG